MKFIIIGYNKYLEFTKREKRTPNKKELLKFQSMPQKNGSLHIYNFILNSFIIKVSFSQKFIYKEILDFPFI